MFNTLNKLTASGKKVIFIVDVPELDFNPRECISLGRINEREVRLSSPCSLNRERFEERTADYHQLVADAENAFPVVTFIHTYKYLCGNEYCDALQGNRLLYSTRDHLTTYGSIHLINKIQNELNLQ